VRGAARGLAALRRCDGAFEGVGRLRLRYRTWEVPEPRAAIVLVHGLGEHSGRYEEAAVRLCGYGFSTYAFDLRGHGVSEGRRGHTPSFEVYLQDLDRFRREVQGLSDPRTTLFLVGHSMGGLIALRYYEEYDNPFRALVALAPWLATVMPVPRWKARLAPLIARVLPALPLRTGLDPRHISRDPEVVEAYRNDPLVHDRITPRLFEEVSRAMGLVPQRAERIQGPVLFMVPGGDRIVDPKRSLAVARSLSGVDVTVKHYPGHYHELLNETDSGLVIQELRDWLAARIR